MIQILYSECSIYIIFLTLRQYTLSLIEFVPSVKLKYVLSINCMVALISAHIFSFFWEPIPFIAQTINME